MIVAVSVVIVQGDPFPFAVMGGRSSQGQAEMR
jgi:hypothetical protein